MSLDIFATKDLRPLGVGGRTFPPHVQKVSAASPYFREDIADNYFERRTIAALRTQDHLNDILIFNYAGDEQALFDLSNLWCVARSKRLGFPRNHFLPLQVAVGPLPDK